MNSPTDNPMHSFEDPIDNELYQRLSDVSPPKGLEDRIRFRVAQSTAHSGPSPRLTTNSEFEVSKSPNGTPPDASDRNFTIASVRRRAAIAGIIGIAAAVLIMFGLLFWRTKSKISVRDVAERARTLIRQHQSNPVWSKLKSEPDWVGELTQRGGQIDAGVAPVQWWRANVDKQSEMELFRVAQLQATAWIMRLPYDEDVADVPNRFRILIDETGGLAMAIAHSQTHVYAIIVEGSENDLARWVHTPQLAMNVDSAPRAQMQCWQTLGLPSAKADSSMISLPKEVRALS